MQAAGAVGAAGPGIEAAVRLVGAIDITVGAGGIAHGHSCCPGQAAGVGRCLAGEAVAGGEGNQPREHCAACYCDEPAAVEHTSQALAHEANLSFGHMVSSCCVRESGCVEPISRANGSAPAGR